MGHERQSLVACLATLVVVAPVRARGDTQVSAEMGHDAIVLGPRKATQPSLAFDGQNYVAAYVPTGLSGSRVRVVRVSASGELLDGSGVPVPTSGTNASSPN